MTTEKQSKEKKEFDWKSVTTPEAAFEKAGYPPFKKLTDPMIPDKYRDAISAVLILAIATGVINGDWVPDYSNPNQPKYFIWSTVSSGGLDFAYSIYYCDYTHADVGFPLYAETPEKALHIFKHFNSFYKTWLLNVKPE